MAEAVTPALDEARSRVRVSPVGLAVLGAVARGEPVVGEAAVAALEALQSAGILDDARRLHPVAADLAWASRVPLLRMLVETSCPQGVAAAHVIVAREAVWYSEPWPGAGPDDVVTYQRAELSTIVWDLGRLVGLHRGGVPVDAVAVELPGSVVDSVLTLAESGPTDWDETRVVALTRGRELWPGLEEAALTRWLAVLASLRSWWRITVGWGDGPAHGRWLSVLDCGPEGYWRWEVPGDLTAEVPDADAEGGGPAVPGLTRLVPVAAAQLWRQLQELLPSGDELKSAMTSAAGAGR